MFWWQRDDYFVEKFLKMELCFKRKIYFVFLKGKMSLKLRVLFRKFISFKQWQKVVQGEKLGFWVGGRVCVLMYGLL